MKLLIAGSYGLLILYTVSHFLDGGVTCCFNFFLCNSFSVFYFFIFFFMGLVPDIELNK